MPEIAQWGGRAAVDALRQIKRAGARKDAPCVICEAAIDYRLEYPNRLCCTVQHIKSRRDYPELTWNPKNWAPAHLQCNREAGAGPTIGSALTDIGVTSHSPGEW